MSFHLKDPAAVLDYSIDWGAQYLAEFEQLATSDWSVSPDEPGGLSVAASSFEPMISTVSVQGGIAGHVYRLANRISTIEGRVDERSMTIRVEDR
jgi:hypothetical protein